MKFDVVLKQFRVNVVENSTWEKTNAVLLTVSKKV